LKVSSTFNCPSNSPPSNNTPPSSQGPAAVPSARSLALWSRAWGRQEQVERVAQRR
jgi:hypothetical protein